MAPGELVVIGDHEWGRLPPDAGGQRRCGARRRMGLTWSMYGPCRLRHLFSEDKRRPPGPRPPPRYSSSAFSFIAPPPPYMRALHPMNRMNMYWYWAPGACNVGGIEPHILEHVLPADRSGVTIAAFLRRSASIRCRSTSSVSACSCSARSYSSVSPRISGSRAWPRPRPYRSPITHSFPNLAYAGAIHLRRAVRPVLLFRPGVLRPPAPKERPPEPLAAALHFLASDRFAP